MAVVRWRVYCWDPVTQFWDDTRRSNSSSNDASLLGVKATKRAKSDWEAGGESILRGESEKRVHFGFLEERRCCVMDFLENEEGKLNIESGPGRRVGVFLPGAEKESSTRHRGAPRVGSTFQVSTQLELL